MEIGTEISQKIRSAIKSKLIDLRTYVDEELPDYIMVMVANRKTQDQMNKDLSLFLTDNTENFTSWLHGLLERLKSITAETVSKAEECANDDVKSSSETAVKRKSSDATKRVKSRRSKSPDPKRAKSDAVSKKREGKKTDESEAKKAKTDKTKTRKTESDEKNASNSNDVSAQIMEKGSELIDELKIADKKVAAPFMVPSSVRAKIKKSNAVSKDGKVVSSTEIKDKTVQLKEKDKDDKTVKDKGKESKVVSSKDKVNDTKDKDTNKHLEKSANVSSEKQKNTKEKKKKSLDSDEERDRQKALEEFNRVHKSLEKIHGKKNDDRGGDFDFRNRMYSDDVGGRRRDEGDVRDVLTERRGNILSLGEDDRNFILNRIRNTSGEGREKDLLGADDRNFIREQIRRVSNEGKVGDNERERSRGISHERREWDNDRERQRRYSNDRTDDRYRDRRRNASQEHDARRRLERDDPRDRRRYASQERDDRRDFDKEDPRDRRRHASQEHEYKRQLERDYSRERRPRYSNEAGDDRRKGSLEDRIRRISEGDVDDKDKGHKRGSEETWTRTSREPVIEKWTETYNDKGLKETKVIKVKPKDSDKVTSDVKKSSKKDEKTLKKKSKEDTVKDKTTDKKKVAKDKTSKTKDGKRIKKKDILGEKKNVVKTKKADTVSDHTEKTVEDVVSKELDEGQEKLNKLPEDKSDKVDKNDDDDVLDLTEKLVDDVEKSAGEMTKTQDPETTGQTQENVVEMSAGDSSEAVHIEPVEAKSREKEASDEVKVDEKGNDEKEPPVERTESVERNKSVERKKSVEKTKSVDRTKSVERTKSMEKEKSVETKSDNVKKSHEKKVKKEGIADKTKLKSKETTKNEEEAVETGVPELLEKVEHDEFTEEFTLEEEGKTKKFVREESPTDDTPKISSAVTVAVQKKKEYLTCRDGSFIIDRRRGKRFTSPLRLPNAQRTKYTSRDDHRRPFRREDSNSPDRRGNYRDLDEPDSGRRRGPRSSLGGVQNRAGSPTDIDETKYDPYNPEVGNVASVIRVTERRKIPKSMQADKSIILKAMSDANKATETKNVRYDPTPMAGIQRDARGNIQLFSRSRRQDLMRPLTKVTAGSADKHQEVFAFTGMVSDSRMVKVTRKPIVPKKEEIRLRRESPVDDYGGSERRVFEVSDASDDDNSVSDITDDSESSEDVAWVEKTTGRPNDVQFGDKTTRNDKSVLDDERKSTKNQQNFASSAQERDNGERKNTNNERNSTGVTRESRNDQRKNTDIKKRDKEKNEESVSEDSDVSEDSQDSQDKGDDKKQDEDDNSDDKDDEGENKDRNDDGRDKSDNESDENSNDRVSSSNHDLHWGKQVADREQKSDSENDKSDSDNDESESDDEKNNSDDNEAKSETKDNCGEIRADSGTGIEESSNIEKEVESSEKSPIKSEKSRSKLKKESKKTDKSSKTVDKYDSDKTAKLLRAELLEAADEIVSSSIPEYVPTAVVHEENKRIIQHSNPTLIDPDTKFIVTLDGVQEEVKPPPPQPEPRPPPPVMPVKPKRQMVQKVAINLQDSDDSDTEAAPTVVTSPAAKINERCRFWPTCSSGPACNYHHPSRSCRSFPLCKFGDKCLFIHPNCRFDATCSRKDCAYTHTSQRQPAPTKPQYIPITSIKSYPGAQSNSTVCKFHPNCSNKACSFLHPKICKFGSSCYSSSTCPFYHPPSSSHKERPWVS